MCTRTDRSKNKCWYISCNDRVAGWILLFLLKRLNVGLQLSQSRWGMQSFLLTMVILGFSIFLSLAFTPHSIGGTIVMWLFFALGIASLGILGSLILFFLRHPSKDPVTEKLNDTVTKLDEIKDAIQDLTTEIKK